MKKKLLAVLLCVIFVFTQISALAVNFSDVNPAKYSWAVDAVNEMADAGIINGYDAVTFGPEDPVKRVDALLLVSRIAGSVADGEEVYLQHAYDKYLKDVSVLGFSAYEKTLSYLLYRGIYTPSELANFVRGNLGNNQLKRYEAAIILTKLVGAEETVKKNTMPVLGFDDSASIPASAKAYVEYCYEQGLMLGMSETEFSPNTPVTRAQMAVLLKKAMDKLDLAYSRGTVDEVNPITDSIKYTDASGQAKTINVVTNTPVKLNGSDVSSLEDIEIGNSITAVYSGTELIFLEFAKVIPDQVIDGVYVGNTTLPSGKKIKIKANVTDTDVTEYMLSDDCSIYIDGEQSSLDKIVSQMHVTLTIKDGKAINITVAEREKSVSGTIDEFIYSSPAKMKIKFSNNTTDEYVLNETVNVTRNGKVSEVSDLKIGDRVTITLLYNKITKVVANSQTKTIEGTVSEIVISAQPTVTVTTSSGDVKCALDTASLEVVVNNQTDADVYDLRLGDKARLTLESSTITKIVVETTPVSADTVNIVGTVANVDTNYLCITLTMADGTNQQIFVKKNATIIDSATQKTRTLSSIKVGNTITAVITSNGFTSEAISIVIL